jgi:gliding motility-associated-like protein
MKRSCFLISFILAGSSCFSQNCEGSLLFDNTNPAVDLPLTNHWYTAANGGYTWECWFKLNQPFTVDIRPLICSIDPVLFEDMYLGFGWDGGWFNEPSNRLVFKVDGPNSTFPTAPNCSYEPAGGFVIGTWYHAAGVMNYNTQTATLFVNGLPVDTIPVTTPPNTRAISTELSFNFNWASSPLPLFGNMDEVRIWDRPLTNAEIANNFDKCMSGNEPNLYLYYRCNNLTDPTVADATPNSNTGIFSITPGWSVQQAPVNGANCTADCDSTSLCDGEIKIEVPDAFSPNGDGHNDYFFIQGWPDCASEFHLLIYDRWGEKVFESDDPTEKWDGTFKGKPLDVAVFAYTLNATLMNGTAVVKSGNISLVR